MHKKLTALFTIKRVILLLVLLAVIGLIIFNQQFHVYERLTFNFQEWRHTNAWRKKSLWLPDYQVVIEAKPIQGIHNNLSGLTWNKDTKTLFAIVNNPTQVIELSTTGELLRKINLINISDPEAIEYIGDNNFIIAEERKQKLIKGVIEPSTTEINAQGAQQLTLGTGLTDNKGIEGLAWDIEGKKIYAAKERNPVHIYEITGFPQSPNTSLDIIVKNNTQRDQRLFIKDISSITFNSHYQHLLVLSDESRLIIEIDKKGHPISSLSLITGHNLKQSIPQAEGMTLDDQDTLYLVGEPNLFYVFKKAPPN